LYFLQKLFGVRVIRAGRFFWVVGPGIPVRIRLFGHVEKGVFSGIFGVRVRTFSGK